jgi:hypothetical protein
MASKRAQREEQIVRRYLELLADSRGNAARGRKSIEHIAEDFDMSAEKLRAYRDGNTTAVGADFVTAFAKLLGRDTGGLAGIEIDDTMGFADPSSNGWYGALMAEESARTAKMRTFSLIDTTRPEAHSALSCYSEMGVTGAVGEDMRYGGGFEPVVFKGSQVTRGAICDDATHINQNLFPDDQKLQAFRGMAKYGNQFGEHGLGMRGGRQYIETFVPRHARTMMIHRDNDGTYDPNYAFKQVIPGHVDPIAKFPAWKIAHFANKIGWGDLYGESIFACGLRSWMQVESMESAMIVRRMERASLRYKHVVDVGMVDGGDDSVTKHLGDYRSRHRKLKTIDTSRNMRNQRISMPGEDDIIIGKRDMQSPADVSVLAGDAYIEAIGDFNHFFNKFLAGLGPPKAHLGIEGEDSKSGVNDKTIVFARKVRAMQIRFIGSGLQQLYWVSMLLRGIDPRSVKYVIFPPSLGTRDELMRAQTQLAHATTIQYLAKAFGQTGEQPSIAWFLRYIMNLDEETVATLELPGMLSKVTMPAGGGAGFKNDPPAGGSKEAARQQEMADVALGSPEVQKQIDYMDFLIGERMIQMRHPKAVEALWRHQQSATKPFGQHFDAVVRSLGITELRV